MGFWHYYSCSQLACGVDQHGQMAVTLLVCGSTLVLSDFSVSWNMDHQVERTERHFF